MNVTFGTLPSDAKIENTIMEANATLNITSVTLRKPFTTTTKATTTSSTTTTTTTTPTTTAAATTTTTTTTSTANPNTTASTATTTSTANPKTTAAKTTTTTTTTTTSTANPKTTAAKTTTTTTTTTTSTANPKTTAAKTTTTTTTTTTSTANPKTTAAKTTTTTTATTTTTKAPARPQPTVEIRIVIIVVFVPALSNPQTPEFKSLATKVETMFDEVYKKKFGPRFIRTIVIAFIAFFRTREESNVQAEVKLVFSEESTEPIPSNTDIVETLKEAAANSTAGFNLTLDATSITVIKSVQIIPLTILTNGNFVAALSNKSSAEFQNRASLIKTGLEPFFLADYPTSFSTISVTNFSDAGVKLRSVPKIRNSMDIVFGADAVLPNSTQIVNTVVRAARNNTLPFQIFTSSIIINGTEFSSGEVSSRISMLTTSFLVAVSLLVPWFI
ncbi:cell wall protein DAN4-like [Sinocyclocheilus anshuiensis]|uniref:cell wall protein DAN4-like n=1 Tax=Sinocyclocheilus anshuiensis TaxID=1608454 RepID=UPI0007B9FD99|nr:PREDICTED: cell wall protein DAN4-like [Sinocyclocheilus anshuiensis]